MAGVDECLLDIDDFGLTRRDRDNRKEVEVRIDRGVESQLKVVEVDPAQFPAPIRFVKESGKGKRLGGLVGDTRGNTCDVGNNRKIRVEAILSKYSRG